MSRNTTGVDLVLLYTCSLCPLLVLLVTQLVISCCFSQLLRNYRNYRGLCRLSHRAVMIKMGSIVRFDPNRVIMEVNNLQLTTCSLQLAY